MIMATRLLRSLGLAIIMFSAVKASADNFRCPNDNIVSTGDSISTVAVKCDPPTLMFKREEPVAAVVSGAGGKGTTRIVYIEVQEWTYKQRSALLHTLIFRNGILAEVRTGGFAE